MTIEEITSGGLAKNANVISEAGHTEDHAVPTEKYIDYASEMESSGLTSGETTHRLPLISGVRASERDALMAKFRAAQASAFFDPEAMALLDSLAKKPLTNFVELAERGLTPEMWVKMAILVRAYLVEPLDNGVRVTLEGMQAMKEVSDFLRRFDVEDQEQDHRK